MSLRASLKVPKYGLFYFDSDRFAVLLVRKLFEPNELDGRNVRGIGKPALDIEKVQTIQELVYKHYPIPSTQRESLWRDCRKAVDTFLRNRKLGERCH